MPLQFAHHKQPSSQLGAQTDLGLENKKSDPRRWPACSLASKRPKSKEAKSKEPDIKARNLGKLGDKIRGPSWGQQKR